MRETEKEPHLTKPEKIKTTFCTPSYFTKQNVNTAFYSVFLSAHKTDVHDNLQTTLKDEFRQNCSLHML